MTIHFPCIDDKGSGSIDESHPRGFREEDVFKIGVVMRKNGDEKDENRFPFWNLSYTCP